MLALAVLTFIGYKQTNRHPSKLYILINYGYQNICLKVKLRVLQSLYIIIVFPWVNGFLGVIISSLKISKNILFLGSIMLLVPGAVSWVLIFRKQVQYSENPQKTGIGKRLLDSCFNLKQNMNLINYAVCTNNLSLKNYFYTWIENLCFGTTQTYIQSSYSLALCFGTTQTYIHAIFLFLSFMFLTL